MPTSRRKPPIKKPGQGLGPRTISGAILDVRNGALFLGMTEKTLRGLVSRQLVPFRRLNARIVFVRGELEVFVRDLPGVSVETAVQNMEARR